MVGAPIVITGPTGWIGQAFLAEIARRDGPDWARNVSLFGSSARDVTAPDGSVLPMKPLDALSGADTEGAHVVHLAYLTKEKVDSLGEQTFFATNAAIDSYLARAIAEGKPASLFVASSGAAKLAQDGQDRHLYGMTKLLQEDRFLAVGGQNGFPVLAGRIWNVAGPHINKLESYALSDFIVQARRDRAIRIAAETPVFRAYLHVYDLAALVLTALAAGIGYDRAIDLSGTEVVEMDDVARAVAAAVDLDPALIQRGSVLFDRPSVYLGDPVAARSLALRCGLNLRDFATQVADTAAYIKGLGSAAGPA